MVNCDGCGWKRSWPVVIISGSKRRITLFRMLKEIKGKTGKKERKKEGKKEKRKKEDRKKEKRKK
jgi:hypothetical protein